MQESDGRYNSMLCCFYFITQSKWKVKIIIYAVWAAFYEHLWTHQALINMLKMSKILLKMLGYRRSLNTISKVYTSAPNSIYE